MPRRVCTGALIVACGCTIIGDLGQDGVSAGGTAGASDGSDGGQDGSTGDVDTELPGLPELTNVRVRIVGDAANITFDPVDDALDYRVYPLPSDDDIEVDADGSVVVRDAIYRCAGDRAGLYMLEDVVAPDEGWNDNAAGGTTILERPIVGYTRAAADAELGFVYLTEADDRVPVYVLGDPDPAHDGTEACGRPVFAATRTKRYVTDVGTRDALIAEHWRDEGIGFWIPREGGADTRPVYEGEFVDDTLLRWTGGAEADARGPGTPIFEILREPAPGTTPLMRVHVQPYCGRPHDALVAGHARQRWVRRQADQPLPALRWSGLTAATTLVAEALDGGCPYQGLLSPQAEPAFVDDDIEHEAYVDLAQMRAASPTGEVFVDGQHDDAPPPRAIARSFVRVAPDLPDVEFFATFPVAEDLRASFGEPSGNVYGQHFASPTFTVSSYSNSHVHFGSMLGELWLAYNDIAAGVNGMVRITATPQARIAEGEFLYVGTEVDVVTTDRRFPQVFISDQPAPLQDNLAAGTTLIVGPTGYSPGHLELQICEQMTWDLGFECPRLPTFAPQFAPQALPPGDTAGSDTAMHLELYVSPSRIYMFVDSTPYACVDLPAAADDGNTYGVPVGAVTVSWGDVLAHSAIDFATGGGAITPADSYRFHRRHMQTTTRRHFDNLAFDSGVAAPTWDEARFPCAG